LRAAEEPFEAGIACTLWQPTVIDWTAPFNVQDERSKDSVFREQRNDQVLNVEPSFRLKVKRNVTPSARVEAEIQWFVIQASDLSFCGESIA
jgi:hypothetical protein